MMKLVPLLLLFAVPAFAQVKKEQPKNNPDSLLDVKYDFKKNKPVNYLDKIDQELLDFDWKGELFNMWDDCFCPSPDQVQQMNKTPRENSPYKWATDKPIIIKLDSADLKFFKGNIIFMDSARSRKTPLVF